MYKSIEQIGQESARFLIRCSSGDIEEIQYHLEVANEEVLRYANGGRLKAIKTAKRDALQEYISSKS